LEGGIFCGRGGEGKIRARSDRRASKMSRGREILLEKKGLSRRGKEDAFLQRGAVLWKGE